VGRITCRCPGRKPCWYANCWPNWACCRVPRRQRPIYDERYLCATPQERIYRNGLWEEGLLPQRGLDAAELAQQKRFHDRMAELKQATGHDGRRLFAIPMALSSRDAAGLALDRISFRQWLLDNGFTAPTLHWLANYACRDDYGMDYAQTSAWAGLHYFACRTGKRPMRRPIPCSPPRMATPGWHAAWPAGAANVSSPAPWPAGSTRANTPWRSMCWSASRWCVTRRSSWSGQHRFSSCPGSGRRCPLP
jgi:hypothetical protein